MHHTALDRQKIENLAQVIGLVVTWLVVGSALLVRYASDIYVVGIAGIFIGAAIALPTLLWVGLKSGKAHFPTITTRDRAFFILAIAGSAVLGSATPSLLALFT